MREVERHDDGARYLNEFEAASRRRARHAVETEGLRIGMETRFLAGPSSRKPRPNFVAQRERPWLVRHPSARRIGNVRLFRRTADVDVVVFFDVIPAVRPGPPALQVWSAVSESRRREGRKGGELLEPVRRPWLLLRVSRVETLCRRCRRQHRKKRGRTERGLHARKNIRDSTRERDGPLRFLHAPAESSTQSG